MIALLTLSHAASLAALAPVSAPVESPYDRVESDAWALVEALNAPVPVSDAAPMRTWNVRSTEQVQQQAAVLLETLEAIEAQAPHLAAVGRPVVELVDASRAAGGYDALAENPVSAIPDHTLPTLAAQLAKQEALVAALMDDPNPQTQEMVGAMVALTEAAVATLYWLAQLEPGYDAPTFAALGGVGPTLTAARGVLRAADRQHLALDVSIATLQPGDGHGGADGRSALLIGASHVWLQDPGPGAERLVWALHDGSATHQDPYWRGALGIRSSDVLFAAGPTLHRHHDVLLTVIGDGALDDDGADAPHASEAARRLVRWDDRETFSGLLSEVSPTELDAGLLRIAQRRDIPEAVMAGLLLGEIRRRQHDTVGAHEAAMHAIEAALAQTAAMQDHKTVWWVAELPMLARTMLLPQHTQSADIDATTNLSWWLLDNWSAVLANQATPPTASLERPPVVHAASNWTLSLGGLVGTPTALRPAFGVTAGLAWTGSRWHLGLRGSSGLGGFDDVALVRVSQGSVELGLRALEVRGLDVMPMASGGLLRRTVRADQVFAVEHTVVPALGVRVQGQHLAVQLEGAAPWTGESFGLGANLLVEARVPRFRR